MRNHHFYGGYLHLFFVMVLTIDQTIQETAFDYNYNYKNIYGRNGKFSDDNDNNDGDIVDDDNRNIAPFQYYEDLDYTNDKVLICN